MIAASLWKKTFIVFSFAAVSQNLSLFAFLIKLNSPLIILADFAVFVVVFTTECLAVTMCVPVVMQHIKDNNVAKNFLKFVLIIKNLLE